LENSKIFEEYLKVVSDINSILKTKQVDFKPEWFKNGKYIETFSSLPKRHLFRKEK